MVSVSASVNFPLHHKVQKFSSGTASPEWSQKKGRKMVVVCVVVVFLCSDVMFLTFIEILSYCVFYLRRVCDM